MLNVAFIPLHASVKRLMRLWKFHLSVFQVSVRIRNFTSKVVFYFNAIISKCK